MGEEFPERIEGESLLDWNRRVLQWLDAGAITVEDFRRELGLDSVPDTDRKAVPFIYPIPVGPYRG